MLTAFGFAAPAASAGPILCEGKFNQDGAVDALGIGAGELEPRGVRHRHRSWNDYGGHHWRWRSLTCSSSSTSRLTSSSTPSSTSSGSPGGPAPGPGFRWEIDEPGFVFGDIYDNFLAGALDGLNGVPAGSPDDVSFALGRAFTLAADETATLNFRTSLVAPIGVPYLIHTDPDSDVSVYFSSDLTIRGGGEPPIPEPGTLTLLGLGLAAAAQRLRRRRLAAGRQPHVRCGGVPAGPRARPACAFQEAPTLTRRRSA
ncbi:MAG: PEP-CTERM sorting domain-containing protein [Comamonadaceae bacterium]|nr:PEP-CTERM sorting domain-containing protein [Comamonadaceae bacterium]